MARPDDLTRALRIVVKRRGEGESNRILHGNTAYNENAMREYKDFRREVVLEYGNLRSQRRRSR